MIIFLPNIRYNFVFRYLVHDILNVKLILNLLDVWLCYSVIFSFGIDIFNIVYEFWLEFWETLGSLQLFLNLFFFNVKLQLLVFFFSDLSCDELYFWILAEFTVYWLTCVIFLALIGWEIIDLAFWNLIYTY